MAETVSMQILREQAAVVDRVFDERLAAQRAEAEAEIESLRDQVDFLRKAAVKGGLFVTRTPYQAQLASFDIDGIASYISQQGCDNVVVMCGAGISTSAGIPDFRTPGTGLYDNLQKYNLPEPQAVFTLDYFRDRPQAFYTLADEMWPDRYAPTPTHHFIAELHKRGKLLRCYTQNIDSLESRAGLPAEKIVAAHGNFDTASTIGNVDGYGNLIPGSKRPVPISEFRAALQNGDDESNGWPALARKYGSLVKPDITFFGEALPTRFFELKDADLAQCDMLIVMGTSLAVAPFNKLIERVGLNTPRLLINRDAVGGPEQELIDVGLGKPASTDLDFRSGFNYRDAFYQGPCDDAVKELAAKLGWGDALSERERSGRATVSPRPAPKPTGKPVWYVEQVLKRQRTSEDV